ncbi:MAG: PIN domain-containing protein [Chloroflexota bacterium]
MTVFVDTSALYALVDEDEDMHGTARGILHALRGQRLVTHAYVLVETMALVARRLPPAATVRLLDGILPIVEVEMVDASLHREASPHTVPPSHGR